jgi:hypothetical protein
MAKCKKCGSKVFFVDDTATYLEIDGELLRQLGDGDLNNRNCVRCNFPEQYEEYIYFEKK